MNGYVVLAVLAVAWLALTFLFPDEPGDPRD